METTARKTKILDFKSPAFLDKFEVRREISESCQLEVFAVYYGKMRITEMLSERAADHYVARLKNQIKSC